MLKFVNAKLNLGLNIIGKREDGYHELQTLFYPIGRFSGTPLNPDPFSDIIEVHPIGQQQDDIYHFTGRPLDCPLEKNLVFRAVSAFRKAASSKGIEIPAFRVDLFKCLPDGAGLGGGSADASFTILALNELSDYIFSSDELIEIATSLGADCPFFIVNSPSYATGIGEILHPVDLDLSGYWALVVKPDIFVSTKEAFRGIQPTLPKTDIRDIVRLPVSEWEEAGLKNDFEKTIFLLHPELGNIKNQLYSLGASYAAMSGSGSSIFGLFPSFVSASSARAHISFPTFLLLL